MITQNDIALILGTDVYAADGDKIGSAGQVYLDERSGEPEWVSVRTGLFGLSESFLPLQRASLSGGRSRCRSARRRSRARRGSTSTVL